MHFGTKGTHSSFTLLGRLGLCLREGFGPVDLELSALMVREDFESLSGKPQTRSVPLRSLEEESPGTVQVLLPTLQDQALSQQVVHRINRLEEKRTLQELITPNTIPEDEEILPMQLAIFSFLEEEKGLCDVTYHPAKGNVLYRILCRAAEPTAGPLLKPPRRGPAVPPSREDGESDPRRNRRISSLEDGYRSTRHGKLTSSHLPSPKPDNKPRLGRGQQLSHQVDHRLLYPIPGGRRGFDIGTPDTPENPALVNTPPHVLVLRLKDGLYDAL